MLDLTPRQYELFILIGKGYTDEQITQTMNIKPNSLKARKQEIREILETTGMLEPRSKYRDFQPFYDFAKRYVEKG